MPSLVGILRSWNRYHILLLEEPAQRHLTRGLAVAITDQPQQCHNRPQRVELRPAERFPEAADTDRPAAIEILPSERATGERLVRDQGDAEFTAAIQHAVGLGPPMEQGVLDLIGCE